jgi:thioredoxin 1
MNKNIISLLSAIIISTAFISFCFQEIAAKNLFYLEQHNKLARSNQDLLSSLTATGDVVLQFYADWCNPCKRMSPIVSSVAEIMPEYRFVKINRDSFMDLAKLFNITSIPTLIFLRDGKEIGRYDGGPLTEKKLQKLINSVYAIA